MTVIRIALANLPYAASPDDSVSRAVRAIAEAGQARADIICFPECYVPGYRGLGYEPPPPDGAFLERAWAAVAGAARNAGVAVILGTERVVDADLRIAVLVIDRAGTPVGFQDKVQLDPSEDGRYSPATGAARSRWATRRSASRSVTKDGAIPRRYGGRRATARRSSSTRTSTRRNRAASGRPPSPIPRTPSTRRRRSAAPPRMAVTLPR